MTYTTAVCRIYTETVEKVKVFSQR